MSMPRGAYPGAARWRTTPPVVFWNLSTPQPASINTSLLPVLTRTLLICSPTGRGVWNVDVSRSLASSARSPQRFSRERERAVADDGDLYGAELEAVEARLRLIAHLGRTGEGGGGERGGCNRRRPSTQERPAIHEHVCSPSFDPHWIFHISKLPAQLRMVKLLVLCSVIRNSNRIS